MSLSDNAVRAMTAPETDEAVVFLLTLDHPDLAEPIRVCSPDVYVEQQTIEGEIVDGLTSRGAFYIAFPFSIELGQDKDDEPPQAQLQICNVDRTIVETLRTITSAPSVDLEIVLLDTPDVVEYGPISMTLTEASYTVTIVEGTLDQEDFLNEPYPGDVFTPSTAPGLF